MLNSITDVFMPLLKQSQSNNHKKCPFIIGKSFYIVCNDRDTGFYLEALLKR